MTEAYSMINQQLQNSNSEHACLEKTSQELKVEEWGTTIAAYILGESIYLAVNARTTSSMDKGFILDDHKRKFFYMKNCNIVVAIAGNITHCEQMVIHLHRELDHWTVDCDIDRATQIARMFIHDWESTGMIFQGSVLMAGWDERAHPQVYLVCRDLFTNESHSTEGLVNGTGGPLFREYFDRHEKPRNSDERLEIMKHSLLYAALKDGNSGGELRVFEIKQSGTIELYRESVIKTLVDNYNAVARCLSHSLFFIWRGCDHKYTNEVNMQTETLFKCMFPNYKKNVVLERGSPTTFVVRLVHLHCPDDELEREDEELAQISRNPRFIKTGDDNRSPFWIGQPTQEFMRILNDMEHTLL